DDAPIGELTEHLAVAAALDRPLTGVVEAPPVLAGLLERDRRPEQLQEHALDRREVALCLEAPDGMAELEIAASEPGIHRTDEPRIEREIVPTDHNHGFEDLAVGGWERSEDCPPRVRAVTIDGEIANVGEPNALRLRHGGLIRHFLAPTHFIAAT